VTLFFKDNWRSLPGGRQRFGKFCSFDPLGGLQEQPDFATT
jgi:hypothetical protein